MLNPDEVRFLAILVQKGHLPKAAAEKVFSAASGGGDLSQLLAQLGLMDAERVAYLRSTGGEDVPPVPGYEYQGQAGFGGTSVVFKAAKRSTGEPAALKIMHRELHQDPLQKQRFVQEAKMLIDLDYPAVIKGYRVGHVKTEDGESRLVFIMEWAKGRTLLELLRDGKQFEEDLALYIILQTAQALQYLHGQGILHRDVKPDNIILTNDNQVKLIDLGFAAHLDQSADSPEDTTLGTAAYMSPEQARGTSGLDVRSDIYSLGATLYQIIVGELPFSGEGTQEQLAARILEALSSPELQSRRISPHMNYFVRKMMEQDRDFRYASVAELIADVEVQIRGKKTLSFETKDDDAVDPIGPAVDGPSPGPGPRDPPSPPKFPRRRRRL